MIREYDQLFQFWKLYQVLQLSKTKTLCIDFGIINKIFIEKNYLDGNQNHVGRFINKVTKKFLLFSIEWNVAVISLSVYLKSVLSIQSNIYKIKKLSIAYRNARHVS